MPTTTCGWVGLARHEIGHLSHAYGTLLLAAFGGAYTALYSRFASQWQYLADLYNQIKSKEIDVATGLECERLEGLRESITREPVGAPHDSGCNAAALLAEWKIGFLADAVTLHLSHKEPFASVVAGWKDDAVVKALDPHEEWRGHHITAQRKKS
jgi:hypothetical protein